MVSTDINPLIGVSLDTGYGPFTFGANVSTIDRAINVPDPIGTQDGFGYAYLGYTFCDWNVTGTWLQSGFGAQQGWSAAVEGRLWGAKLFGEYAQLTTDAADADSAIPTPVGLLALTC